MKLLKNTLFLASISLLVFTSCKNDLKLNAPYKEIPTVYAVLNPYEKIQMIRINKTFLGEGDANKMARVSDSVNYAQDEITVTLNHSSSSKTIIFRDSMVTTEPGAFNTNQRIYVSSEQLETQGTYTLTVKNTHTGNVFTATASPIADVDSLGLPFEPPYFPYDPHTDPNSNLYINYAPVTAAATKTNSVYFKPVPKAEVYMLVIRNHFYNDLGATRSYDFVDYVVNDPQEVWTPSSGGPTYIRTRFSSKDYMSTIGVNLSKKNLGAVPGRKLWLMEFIVYASTQEYVDFVEFSKPSLSLNQNKPLYSNFKDKAAFGIFTFRSKLIVQKEPSVEFINYYSSNSNTCKYNFYNANNMLSTCK